MSVDDRDGPLDYEASKVLARSEDPSVRAALARRADIPPELLYYLAEDSDAEVRRIVANNEAAPDHTHLLLANDQADDVRSQLAAKIAKSYEKPKDEVSEKSRQMSLEALSRLANDQITAVRRALALAIKDVPGAPGDIILKMAGDPEILVSGPVLQHSPVLTDDDLIRIIEAPSASGARNAISKRQAVNSLVSEAIIATDDISAIGDLLSNTGAQILEATLDDLVGRAESIEYWHAPLVSRHGLSHAATSRLANFVANNLLEELQGRDDIEESTMTEVKRVVKKRLQEAEFTVESEDNLSTANHDFLVIDPPLAMVRRLFKSRKLDGDMVSRALEADDYSFVLATLVVNTGVDVDIVKKIFKDQNAKGIAALCLLSNIPAASLIKIQQRMGRIPPSEVIQPDEGGYPMTQEDAEWQIEFHTKLASRPIKGAEAKS